MSEEEKQQDEFLERFVAGTGTLQQVIEASGIDRGRIGRRLKDEGFGKKLDDAMERWQILQKMELMCQQSVASQRRSKLLEKPDELDAKDLAALTRQINQETQQNFRYERERRRAQEKRRENPDYGEEAEPHPHLDEKTEQRLRAEMNRIHRLAG